MNSQNPPQMPPSVPLEPLWEGWKPDLQSNPHNLQERHSPTLPVHLRGVTDSSRNDPSRQSRRRILDLRLWESLSPPQQDAAIEIARACLLLSRGIGFVQADWARVPGSVGADMGSEMAELAGIYGAWAGLCRRERLSHGSIVDILVFGQNCSAQDRDRKLRRGSSKRNLQAGLSLYCKLRGWPVT